ncbi:MAG TPA: hypothetical protein VMW05_02475 [Methyloceanibacter sp.]|nr:hypothetical protein [Methyloceanibacter sp.]
MSALVGQLWRASVDLHDFDAFRASFVCWDGRFEQMSRGPFAGRLGLARVGRLRAFRAETNQSILTRGAADPGCLTIIPVTRRSEGTRHWPNELPAVLGVLRQ